MRISIIGAGHVGLVSAACFAERGYDVILSDHDIEKVKLIKQAIPPFHEEGLKEILEKIVSSGKLRVDSSTEHAIPNTDVTFVAVGTPSRVDGSIDLTLIKDSSARIGKALQKKNGYHLVVIRSTVVPGTTENVIKTTVEKNAGKTAGIDFGLAMQPEFLREGSAICDTMNPDRIIIGEHDNKSGETLEKLYREFYREILPPTLHMNLVSAEMIKYASNAFLATKVSFINEIAGICEKVPGLDVVKVVEGMGLDQRIGKRFLHAGAGFGGFCLPKDVRAIAAFAKAQGNKPRILRSVLAVNKDQTHHVVELAKKQLGTLRGKNIAILGLAFKPGTDDLREAPSLRIIRDLLKQGAKVVTYDPAAIANAKKLLGRRITYADSVWSCLKNTDAALVVTEWEEFKNLTPADFKKWMRNPIIIDARRVYDSTLYRQDTRYAAIGLGL